MLKPMMMLVLSNHLDRKGILVTHLRPLSGHVTSGGYHFDLRRNGMMVPDVGMLQEF